MFWNSMSDMENYRRQEHTRTFAIAMDTCQTLDKENKPCSPAKCQEVSMYEDVNNSPSRMSCDGSPNCSFTLRRPSFDVLQDNNTQDSGYSPSEVSRVSPRRQFSFSSNPEDFLDLSELEDDNENTENESPNQFPSGFSKLISGTLSNTSINTSSPKCTYARPLLRKAFSVIETSNTTPGVSRAKSCLFGNAKDNQPRSFKRPEPPTDVCSPLSIKRSRLLEGKTVRHVSARSLFQRSISNQESIKTAIHRSATEPDLVADFSKSYCLPLISGKHQDLRSVTPETVADLMRGNFEDKVASFKIIDCRYPYEYEGGHIEGAHNLYTKDQILAELLHIQHKNAHMEQEEDKRHILIFHCEFSSERAPNLSRFLRSHDRQANKDFYPYLRFPEVYLLDGGYKNFFETHAHLCTPGAYVPMLHAEHEESLKHFRAKSKTFNCDIKMTKSKSKHRL